MEIIYFVIRKSPLLIYHNKLWLLFDRENMTRKNKNMEKSKNILYKKCFGNFWRMSNWPLEWCDKLIHFFCWALLKFFWLVKWINEWINEAFCEKFFISSKKVNTKQNQPNYNFASKKCSQLPWLKFCQIINFKKSELYFISNIFSM